MAFIPQRLSMGTRSSVTGTTGSGAAGRVAYWSGVSQLSSSASFLFDGTTLAVPDGAAATPSYAFASDATTGFYRRGSGAIGISSSGADVGKLGIDTSFTCPTANPLIIKSLSANSNGLRFYADTATDVAYIINGYNSDLEIGANNTTYLTISAAGAFNFAGSSTVRKDQNATTLLQVRNDNAGASAAARIAVTSDQGDFNIYANSAAAGDTVSLIADAAFGGGMDIGILGSNALRLRTNNTVRLTLAGTGLITSSAPFEITGTTSYLQNAVLNSTQRDALTPATGMVIYNSTASKLQVYSAGSWVDLH